jgi:hypothetical protein
MIRLSVCNGSPDFTGYFASDNPRIPFSSRSFEPLHAPGAVFFNIFRRSVASRPPNRHFLNQESPSQV